jgi:hypothetical protein
MDAFDYFLNSMQDRGWPNYQFKFWQTNHCHVLPLEEQRQPQPIKD